jgi:signal transduction histidine kinase
VSDAAPIRVLNVDDYPEARYARTKVLREAGFEVCDAASGQEALELVTARRPHLVVLDMHLPDLHGSEVCRRVKGDPATASIQILHVSASAAGGDDYARALDMGADGYLVEPVEPQVLVATVRALARARRAEEAVQTMSAELLAAEQAARVAAEAANRAKDEFLAVLSHELRTPLTAILGWVSMLGTGRLDAQTTARAFEIIGRNARLQVQLVDELLDVSRMISGKMSIVLSRIDVTRVLSASIDALRAAAADKQIGVELTSAVVSITVRGDTGRLQQVFTNLLTNAIKFTPAGGRVGVSVELRDDTVRVAVRDTGRGIDPAFLPHLFEPFRQEDAVGRRARMGLGLGLAIARHLVELHGGTIEAASEGLGRGATLTVTLPLVRSTEAVIPDAAAGDGAGGERSASLAGVRIVLVEDEPDTRDALALMLRDAGAEVVSVDTVQGALDAIRARPPDVLISDIGMPDEDGYDLIRAVRALGPGTGSVTPAIAVTAFARGTDYERALSEGYDLHLAKPIERDALTVAVRELLGGRLLRKLRGE